MAAMMSVFAKSALVGIPVDTLSVGDVLEPVATEADGVPVPAHAVKNTDADNSQSHASNFLSVLQHMDETPYCVTFNVSAISRTPSRS